MTDRVAELLQLLELERLEDNFFRGESRDIGTRFVFGGQVLGQALSAAQQTVAADRIVHSLHAYFLRAGDIEHGILYQVERTRDGGSFSARRVTAIQHGKPICVIAASFQSPETGAEHQQPMPVVPAAASLPSPHIDPEKLAQVPAKVRRWLTQRCPFEFRPVYPWDELEPTRRPPLQQVWFRLASEQQVEAPLKHALLAYASDFHLIGTATFPHGVSYLQPNVQMASLDHAMWFHRDFDIGDWLLYDCDSPSAQGARGLARGMIYDRAGRLIASTAQEGLIRILDAEAGETDRHA